MRPLTKNQTDAPTPGRVGAPDFLCIGQQKAGTQWLYDMLQFQPDFWVTPIKELHFLTGHFRVDKVENEYRRMKKNLRKYNKKRELNTRRQIERRDFEFFEHALTYDENNASLEWYGGLFAPKGELISGDITPAYSTLDKATISRVARAWPDLRLVLLVRDPVSRAWSAFNMRKRTEIIGRHCKEPSQESISAFHQPTSLDQVADFLSVKSVRKRSFATVIYDNWRQHFDASQFKIVFFDDIVKSPDAARRGVLEFFGLQDTAAPTREVAPDFNRKAEKPKRPMDDEVRAYLVDAFRQELVRSAEMFGGPAERWPERYGVA